MAQGSAQHIHGNAELGCPADRTPQHMALAQGFATLNVLTRTFTPEGAKPER